MIATGIAIGAVVPRLGEIVGLTIQAFGTGFLALLTLHLRNINQDRVVALALKENLRMRLEFGLINQNITGKKRWRAPRLMVWFAGAVAIAWAIWTLTSFVTLVRHGL